MTRLLISELKVSQAATIPLVCMESSVKETRSHKPYVNMRLYDGINDIYANFWNYNGPQPELNTVYDFHAVVDSYQGNLQLNVKSFDKNTSIHINEFAPASDYNIADVYKCAYTLISEVSNDFFRGIGLWALEEFKDLWITVPGAKTIHHAYAGGTLIHSYSVATIAKAMAMSIPGADVDTCTVCGFLHDIGKLFTYAINGITIELTNQGSLLDHVIIGEQIILEGMNVTQRFDKEAIILQHIIAAHHGLQEFGAAVTPACIEAYIVYHADAVDAAAEQIREASKKASSDTIWTDRIWALSNRPHLKV